VVVMGVGQLKQRLHRLLACVDQFRLCELDSVPAQTCEYVTVYNWNGNKGMVVAEVPALPVGEDYSGMDMEDVDLASLGLEEDAQQDTPGHHFSPADVQVMKEVFIDIPNALVLLGEAVCSFLHDKVKHEAVEYLQQCAHTDVPCVDFLVTGEGRPQELTLNPPKLHLGGLLSIGQGVKGSVTLHNPTTAMAEVTIACDRLQVRSLTSSAPLTPAEAATFSVYVRPERVLLMPHTEVTLEVTAVIGLPGEYSLTLPLSAEHPCACVDNLTITARATGPRVRFHEAELDYGLIGVGETARRTLVFTNESDVPAKFAFYPMVETEMADLARRVAEMNANASAKSARPLSVKSKLKGAIKMVMAMGGMKGDAQAKAGMDGDR
jgi:hypothetical protein